MVAPVSRDGFFYDSQGLFVRPEGATYAHHRRDASALYDLLTHEALAAPEPVLTKKGDVAKRQPRPPKDEPGHFYTAQLALYGLKVYKTKDAAKKHLLAAFKDDRTLPVSSEILQLERELREEYEAANGVTVGAPPSDKAQRDALPRSFDLHQGAVADDDFEKEIQEVKDDATVITGIPELLKGLSSEILVVLVARLVGADPSLRDKVEAELADIRTQSTLPPPRTKQTARKGDSRAADADDIIERLPQMAIQDASQEQAPKPAPVRKQAQQTARKSTGGKAPMAKASPKPKAAASRAKSGPAVSWKELVTSASYDVTASYLAEEWPDYAGPLDDVFLLRLRPSSTGAHVWGSFDFGAVSGVLKTCTPPPAGIDPESDAPVTANFMWRGREQGEGEMTFGDDNTGTITFIEGGRRIKGVINGSFLEENAATFTGTAKQNIRIREKTVKEWKAEWRGINDAAYNAAGRARWGGWGGDVRPERPAASDTSEGGLDEGSDGLEDGGEDGWDAY